MNWNASRFNKEKLCFLAAAIFAALAVHQYVVTAPVTLERSEPLTGMQASRAADIAVPVLQAELTYFSGTRKTPFLPGDFHPVPGIEYAGGDIEIPEGPTQPAVVGTGGAASESPPIDPAAVFEFMGVVVFNNERFGLLRPNNGSRPRRVQAGEVLADVRCTVVCIEPQAIWLKDSAGIQFVLKDKQAAPTHISIARIPGGRH